MSPPVTAAAASRQRVSVWADMNFLLSDAMVAPAVHVVDDISLLVTVNNTTGPGTLTPVIDVKPGSTMARLKTAIPAVIKRCHRHKIQCLAGYDLVVGTSRTKRFKAWLDELVKKSAADRTAEIERYARELVALVLNPFGHSPAPTPFESFDGISFDFEDVPGSKAQAWSPILVEFYRAVAKLLRDPAGDRIVAVAAGGMVSDTHSHFFPGVKPKSLSKAAKTLGSGIAHRYEMAKGAPNLIVRPMAYDNFTIDPPTPASTVQEWHQDVINHAIGPEPGQPPPPKVAGISRASFQLGIKWFYGSSNKRPPGRNLDSILSHSEIQTRCKLLRRRGVGLVLFAYPTTIKLTTGAKLPNASAIARSFWSKVQRYNFVLNGPVDANGDPDFGKFDPKDPAKHTIMPGLTTTPDQVPLGKAGVARLVLPAPATP